MIEHVSLGTHRYGEAVEFYRKTLAPLGLELMRDTGKEAAFGTSSHWCFFLYPVPAEEAIVGKGMHVALGAASREQVHSVHAAALKASAEDIFTPRERPDISSTYFGAMFKDRDGHGVEVFTNAS